MKKKNQNQFMNPVFLPQDWSRFEKEEKNYVRVYGKYTLEIQKTFGVLEKKLTLSQIILRPIRDFFRKVQPWQN